MIEPPLDQLLSQVDSRYSLVVAAAKRAREIMSQENMRQEEKAMKSVSIALEEIGNGKVKCVRARTK